MQLPLIIFDDGLGQLAPMTDLRAVYEIRTGMLTTAGRIAASRPRTLAGYWVPQHLVPLIASRANAHVNDLPHEESVLLINGRWAMPDGALKIDVNQAGIEQATGHVVIAALRRNDAEHFLRTNTLPDGIDTFAIGNRVLYRHPWDVLAALKQTLLHDITVNRITTAQLPDNATIVGEHPIEVHASAIVYPNVVLDAEHGPILIAERAVVRPGAIVSGPAYIGPDSTVLDRALIKANTSIGMFCKVAGEVGGTIFQGYANKSHDGHLGDSWVGRWANFGAGTTNSNLLNTYGEVTMRPDPDGPRHRTGLTFLGAIVGDHVKFAINTRIMTGSCINTGAMIATTAPPPTTVRRFAWLTDEGERLFRLDKFLEVMTTVMGRRHVQPVAPYVDLIKSLHAPESARSVPPPSQGDVLRSE